MMASISAYAEYLPNLRQVSIHVALPTPSIPQTTATFTNNGSTFSFTHEGQMITVDLPAPVFTTPIKLPELGSRELSFRFPTPPPAAQNGSFEPEPWTALSLPSSVCLSCSKCDHVVINNVREWKDLPSGGWADMMELWHCHKPDVPHAKVENAGKAKGYAAGNALVPARGTGLVDAGAFHFLGEDCDGTEVSRDRIQLIAAVFCDSAAIASLGSGSVSTWAERRWSVSFSDSVTDTNALEQIMFQSTIVYYGERLRNFKPSSFHQAVLEILNVM